MLDYALDRSFADTCGGDICWTRAMISRHCGAPKNGDITRYVNVVDILGFLQVCVDKLNVFTTPFLIRQWSENIFYYVLFDIVDCLTFLVPRGTNEF